MTGLRRTGVRSMLLCWIVGAAIAASTGTQTARATEESWLSVPGGLPLFDLNDVAPGDDGSATFTVTNPQAFAVEFSIAIPSLATDDNGCNEPELALGDATCGTGGGELQQDLRLALSAVGANERTISDGTVDQWLAQPRVDTVALSGFGSRTYRITYELPVGASNIVQSDKISFAFEMRLEQVLGSIVVSEPPVVVVGATASLPRTGVDAGVLVTVALSLAAAGFALRRWSMLRRRAR